MATKPGIEIRPDLKKASAALRKRVREMTDLTTPNRRIATFLDNWVQRNFDSEGELSGGWTPFAAGGRWIPGIGLDASAKLLQHTGELRASFRPFYDSKQVGIGSDLERAKYHEEGTSTIPARPMLPREKDIIEPVLEIFNRYFKEIGEKPLW